MESAQVLQKALAVHETRTPHLRCSVLPCPSSHVTFHPLGRPRQGQKGVTERQGPESPDRSQREQNA